MKHKHADLIKAWADGAEIECLNLNSQWFFIPEPRWEGNTQYRIKPVSKPNVVTWHALNSNFLVYNSCTDRDVLNDTLAHAVLRLEIDYNDPDKLVLVSATLEKS